MNDTDDLSRFDGSLDPGHGVALEGLDMPFESGVLPEDFSQRLTRLKEASGLTWSGLSRALGVDPKQMYRWRRGTEPCGGAMLSLFRFASRMPGGLNILMGEGPQMSFLED